MIILTLIILLGASLLLCFGKLFTNKQLSDIPKKNEISFIEIYGDYINDITKYHVIEGEGEITQIYDVLTSGKKIYTMESVNDIPYNVDGKLTKIILVDSNNNTSLFVYQTNDGKYYIEKSYEGIYEISVEAYKIITQYFITG